ncbi:MAG: YfhO family protein, partial [Firmicutes bacterium]|nr:YfhO family protein [Bacillota bacterium]
MAAFKNKEYITAFLLGIIIALIGFAAAGVYPFGEYAAVCSDMEQQFLDLTAGIFNNIKSGKSLFVTYGGGMGVNLLAWSAYLLYDPLNILFLLFDVEYYQEVYLVIDIIKYGLIALCASVYLKKSNYTVLSGAFNIALAVLYAFGSFCLKSMINVMWLSNVAMLPIVLLAIERVIEKKKTGLLFFSFLYCTASNFYLAFVT